MEEVAGMRRAWKKTPPVPVSVSLLLRYHGILGEPEPEEKPISEEAMQAMRERFAERLRADTTICGVAPLLEVMDGKLSEH